MYKIRYIANIIGLMIMVDPNIFESNARNVGYIYLEMRSHSMNKIININTINFIYTRSYTA